MEGAVIAATITGLSGIGVFVVTKYLERRAVSTAIFAEIQRLLTVITDHRDKWVEWKDKGETERHPLVPFSCDVYQKHVSSLGLIAPKYVGKVVKFYGYVNFLNALQSTREQYRQDKNETAFVNIYLASLERIVRDFGEAFTEALEKHALAARPGRSQQE